ncbi:MAG: ROK family protein [Ginsengibacter sp.]
MRDYKVIGIDIGGSHITAGMVDMKSREVMRDTLTRRHVDSKASAGEIITAWAAVIDKLFNDYPQAEKKIGIAMPGPFDYEEGISLIKGLDKFEGLFGLNIKKLLAEKLKIDSADILMMNDASCFLKGEVFSGAAVNCNNVIGVTLGTGLGSARFHDGEIYDGDLYYTPYKDATAEDYLSSRWFLKSYKKATGNDAKNVKELSEKIYEDPNINSLFIEFGKNLGHVLLSYAKKQSCETIVIGGNIIKAWELFFRETESILSLLQKPVSMKKAVLGEESALIGAASLWQ